MPQTELSATLQRSGLRSSPHHMVGVVHLSDWFSELMAHGCFNPCRHISPPCQVGLSAPILNFLPLTARKSQQIWIQICELKQNFLPTTGNTHTALTAFAFLKSRKSMSQSDDRFSVSAVLFVPIPWQNQFKHVSKSLHHSCLRAGKISIGAWPQQKVFL